MKKGAQQTYVILVELGTLRDPCVERIVTYFALTRASHKSYFVTKTMVFTELHFRFIVVHGDIERVPALIGMQKSTEISKVGDLRVVWFG